MIESYREEPTEASLAIVKVAVKGLIYICLVVWCILSPSHAFSEALLRMVGPEDLGGAWAEIISRFQEKSPGIRIEYTSGPWSTDERQNMYIRSFISGHPFELVYMDVIWAARFADRGWILPLDRWFDSAKQEAFFRGDIEAGYYKEQIYRVPVRSDVGVLYYRRDLVRNPPGTWDDLEKICREATNPPERYGIVFQGMQYEGLVCNYLEYLWGAGGTVLDRMGNVDLDSPENVLALGFMKKMIESNYAPKSIITFQEQQALEFFEKGRALFMRNWPYAWNILSTSSLRGKVGIAPVLHRAGKKSIGTLGGWGLGIARGINNPELAWKFIEFASSEQAQKILHFKRGAVPSRKSLFHDEEILKENPHYKDLYRILLTARPRLVHPDYPRISSVIQKNVSAVLVGIESPETAALSMDLTIESLVFGKTEGWVRKLVLDRELYETLRNTTLFTLLTVPCEFLLGLLFALLINTPLRGKALSRLSVLVPWALPTAVMAMAWQWMFNNPFGVINDLLVRSGLIARPLDWLSSPAGAMGVAVFSDVWKTTPFVAIILLAGLQSIPRELDESFSMDGANPLTKFFHLTLPLLIPFIRVALIFRVIHAAGIFDLIWVLTKGGPAGRTRTLSLYIYDLAFKYDDMGYGLFLTLLFMATLMVVSFLIVRICTLRYERIKR
jgi:multiple sugar transport system substrate-binding protein